MEVPREHRLDAIKFKEEMQAELEKKLAGLSPEERMRKLRELVENGPFGEMWKQLRGPSRSSASRPESCPELVEGREAKTVP